MGHGRGLARLTGAAPRWSALRRGAVVRCPAARDGSVGRVMDSLLVSVLVAAAVVLVVVQLAYRRRVLKRREAAGEQVIGRSSWVVLAVMAAFFLFAVFVFPQLVR